MLFCGLQYSIGSVVCFQQAMPVYLFWDSHVISIDIS